MSAKLILSRKSSILNRRQRYKVIVDGVEEGQIKNDDTEEFTLEPGQHTLQCKLNWMSSEVETVTLQEGVNVYRSVSNGLRFIVPLYFLMLAGVFLPFSFRFAKTPVPDYIETLKIIFLFPAITYSILCFTVFR
ncbi:MAG: hypothetical protein ACR2KZ_16865, partial [Segetibacter sp.]